jgi:MFS family permease
MDDVSLEKRTTKKVLWRLIPFLGVLFFVNIIDRINVGFAALSMNQDLGFTSAVYGFGAGVFFIGYFLMEIPGNLMMVRFGPRIWFARILITWGFISALTGFVQTPTQFYTARFLLGLAEASFYPGIIFYMSNWFRVKDLAIAVALFQVFSPLSSVFSSPVSTYILGISWLDLAGWQWLFILEGLPAVILGFITLAYLTDKPEDAKWLADEERACLVKALATEKTAKLARKHYTLLEAFRDRDIVLLVVIYFSYLCGFWGLVYFLPTLVKALSASFSNQTTGFLVMIPYIFTCFAVYAVGHHSDKTGERRWHVIGCLLVGAISLVTSALLADTNVVLSMICFTVAAMGLYSVFAPFWAIPSSFLTASVAAGSIALINSFGNLGGFVGPYFMGLISAHTGGSYMWGTIFLACCLVFSALLLMTLRKSGVVEQKGTS